MERHADDLNRYIILTERATFSDEEDLMDSIIIPDIDPQETLLEDINDMVFKLRSYCESDENEDYARGVEEGFALAAEMLERIIERYSYISKE